MIHSINHIGIGVKNIGDFHRERSSAWGFNFKVSDACYAVGELEAMFGHAPEMRMANYMHPRGGPLLELFQHKRKAPEYEKNYHAEAGCGMSELGLAVSRIDEVVAAWGRRHRQLEGIRFLPEPGGKRCRTSLFDIGEAFSVRLMEDGESRVLKAGILGISHIGIRVADLPKMRRFYSDALGFDEEVSGVEDCRLSMRNKSLSHLSSLDGGRIRLLQAPKGKSPGELRRKPRFGSAGICEIGFEVSDIREAYDTLLEAGATGLVEPLRFSVSPGPRGRLAYVSDPEGNVLELVEVDRVFRFSLRTMDRILVRPLARIYRFVHGGRRSREK